MGKDMGINLVIHIDRILTDDEQTLELKAKLEQIVSEIDPNLTMHDFRAVSGPSHTNLVFDVVIPPAFSISDAELRKTLSEQYRMVGIYYCVVTIDHNYSYVPKGKAR